MACHWISIP